MIKAVFEAGLSDELYYLFHVLGALSVVLFNLWYGGKYGIGKKQSLFITLFAYPLVYIWIYIEYWIESGFRDFGGNNIVRGFVYMPLIAYPFFRMMKVRFKNGCDFIAPCVCLTMFVSHIGCIFPGCCHGYECPSFGIYNIATQTYVFPVQLFEAVTALAVALIVVRRAKARGYASDGRSYPLMLVLYGSTRFLWEFARDNEKIWLGCSVLAFHALFMTLVGAVALCILHGRRGSERK